MSSSTPSITPSVLRRLLPGAAYAALAVADTVAAGRGERARRARRLLKPALMPTLAVAFLDGTRGRAAHPAAQPAAHPAAHPAASRLRKATASAQVLSFAGDVALLGRSERAFLTGVGSFFGAHVAYLTGFLAVRGQAGEHDTTGLRVAAATWLVAAPTLGAAAGRQDPTLRLPVAAYATILTAMFAASRMLDPALPAEARRNLQAGTALFLASDTVLGVQEFLLPERRPALDALVMATYTAGQGLIARGVAGAL
ncbi:lysoplasmalogenase [Nocardioides sp. zg-536]|uniref:Lysoplasmalogenase n=1 Tax=Nocardioides faecalis TaxID=2803858 RepID=A0A938Y515_9ACTN|nr:lysoplasmalogenase [Nocardioides faecalis]MBM9459337.1 lysoplasmalogenase [Nocardioides faecalis]MBS4751576.1 lysoplasmalogenase [Nocardioides faecalis]QVI59546.1 lysoplasmalogenase [Nocardioides faecalis]